jgi:hypothetical protein
MDFIVQLPVTKAGFDAILVVVDRLTKQVHFIPTTTSATAPDVARTFFHHIFRLHGILTTIILDCDPKFVFRFWQELLKQLGTQAAMSSAYHPQTDGQTERANRTLEDMLKAFVNYRQDNWDDCLPAAEFAYNNSVQASTGFSPFYLDCGQHPITPGTLVAHKAIDTKVPSTEEFLTHWCATLEMAKESLQAAQDRQAATANQHRRHQEYKVDDQVLLSTAYITAPADKQRPARKLQPKYIGPFPITTVVSPTAYRLALPYTLRIHPVFHVSLLKPYHPTPEHLDRRQPPPPPLPTPTAATPEYEVESILDKRTFRRQKQYLVLWKGYPQHDATWEPMNNLDNAKEAIEIFEAGHTPSLQ